VGFTPWIAVEDLLPGQQWKDEIRRQIKAAGAILIILSSKSIVKPGYFQIEISYALDVAQEQLEGDIFVIPIRLDDCQVPARLNDLQWVDLFSEAAYSKISNSLNARALEIAERHPQGQGDSYGPKKGMRIDSMPYGSSEEFGQESLEGQYLVQGINPDGSLHKGIATIKGIDDSGNVFTIISTIENDVFRYVGRLRKNILHAEGEGHQIVYFLQWDGSMSAHWGASGLDRLIPMAAPVGKDRHRHGEGPK